MSSQRATEEVVELVSQLIRFDTTNTGEPETTKGEAECATWVAQQLEDVGYTTQYVESGREGRGNVFARLPGPPDSDRGAPPIHAHLDVVPAEPSDWSVHPFSGAVKDGYIWGRGAVDMKDMAGMALALARQFKRDGTVPPRELVFAFLADEESGGARGSHWLVENRPDSFEGVTEAGWEVGRLLVDLKSPWTAPRSACTSSRRPRRASYWTATRRRRPGRPRLVPALRQRRHRGRRGGRAHSWLPGHFARS